MTVPIPTSPMRQPSDSLALKNQYRHQTYEAAPILSFEEARAQLPVPIMPGSQYDPWIRMYWRVWEIAWTNLHQPAEGTGFVDNYIRPDTHDHIFMWDSAFSALYGIYGRRSFDFSGNLNNFYAWQHPDGFICRKINDRTGADSANPFDPDSTGPNVFAWAEWRYFRATGDEERLKQVFYPLAAYYHWFRRNRTWRDGMYWSTGTSSGMNNQTRIPESKHFHAHHVWVDVTIQAAINAMALQQMALALGEEAHALEFGSDREYLRGMINKHLWNPETHFYHDIDHRGQYVKAKTIAAYWALHDKELVPSERLERFLEHLSDERGFNTGHPLPTMSVDSPGFDEKGGYWRGGVWPVTNYMVFSGLRNRGRHGLAHRLAMTHIDYVSQIFDRTGYIWENYAPMSMQAGEDAKKNVIGWSGLSPIACLIEDIIGIYADWPTRRVYWNRRLTGDDHLGVQNYPLGPEYTIDIYGDNEMIFINSDTPFTLVLKSPTIKLQTAVAAGSTTIPLS